jgi:formiminotetrahydrofolate cyclodeaminase
MLTEQHVTQFLDELSSNSPAPGGGSVAALSGALGSALTSMVCSLTVGKKKYETVEAEMQKILEQSEILRAKFTELIDKDTDAFTKVMEATNLPKENDQQKALRSAAIQAATKEAALLPLTVMRHCIDALALTKIIAAKGNPNAISDAGVSALMLKAACDGAALNVRINLSTIKDVEFVGWTSKEAESLQRTCEKMSQETLALVGKTFNS